MTPLKQPRGSRLCGQCCVAMATDRTMNSVCGQLGSKGTKTKALAAVLRQHGFRCADRLTRISPAHPLPARALVKVSFRCQRNWHWVLWWDGRLQDPDAGRVHPGNWTSFLDLT